MSLEKVTQFSCGNIVTKMKKHSMAVSQRLYWCGWYRGSERSHDRLDRTLKRPFSFLQGREMSQEIETDDAMERCPERLREYNRVICGQESLCHIGLQVPDDRFQGSCRCLNTNRARPKVGNCSPKHDHVITRIGKRKRPIGPGDLVYICCRGGCLWHPSNRLTQACTPL